MFFFSFGRNRNSEKSGFRPELTGLNRVPVHPKLRIILLIMLKKWKWCRVKTEWQLILANIKIFWLFRQFLLTIFSIISNMIPYLPSPPARINWKLELPVGIPNENNFNTQTIALHAIPNGNGGKMRFRPAFLNRIGSNYFTWIAMIQER
jgi:hypothetical protein